MRLQRGRDRGLGPFPGLEIGPDGEAARRVRDLADEIRAVHRDQPAAFGGEPQRHRPADPLCGAGDDRDLVGEAPG